MREIILKEKFEPGLKHALFSNFSNYIEAFLELTDNAVSNRIPGRKLKIDILVGSKLLEITNFGGYGMDVKELREFLEWGKIKKRRQTDIGAYSQGGKAAMGYLGTTMQVVVSPRNKKLQYQFDDDDLHDYKLKNYKVIVTPVEVTEGYVRIKVTGLKRKIREEDLKKALINTYRPLIDAGEAEIYYNGVLLKIEPFPIEDDRYNFSFKVKNSIDDLDNVRGWIGHLVSRSGVKGGIRCYKLGRLIYDQQFFGHPDPSYKQTLNLLFGEVHLDHVPVTTNKTGFDCDSIQWSEVQEKMFEILQPYIDELLGREIKEPTDEEKERVKKAREMMAEILKRYNKNFKGNEAVAGESFGQKSRETLGEKAIDAPTPSGKKYNPRTPPPPNAEGKRRRVREFMEWVIRPIDERLRSIIEEVDGKKLLVINNLFPGFVKANGNMLYLIESAAIQLTLPEADEKMTPQDYIKNFDELYAFCCENFNSVKEDLSKKKI